MVTSGMALRRCSSLDEFVEVFNKVVLVSYSKLVEISEGSLCFTVLAETSSALKELWDMYKSGTLQNRLQEFLVTDEIKQLASGEDVEVTVYIDEQAYNAAYLDLMLLQKQGKMLKHINFVFQLQHAVHNMSKKPLGLFWQFRPSNSNYNDTLDYNLIQGLSIRHKTSDRAERQFTQLLLSDGGQKKPAGKNSVGKKSAGSLGRNHGSSSK